MAGVSTTPAMRGEGFWKRAAFGVLALTVVAAAGFAGWYRQTYNVWPGQGASGRVHWCGRDYQTGGLPRSWQQITSQERFPIHAVGQYPPLGWSRQDLFAPESKRLPVSPPLACAMVVYLRTGPNEYQAYGLLGGP
jgi:hypothetical protein